MEEESFFYEPKIPEKLIVPEIPEKVFSFKKEIKPTLDISLSQKNKNTICYELKMLVNESLNFFKKIVSDESKTEESVQYLKNLHQSINKKVDILEKIYLKNKIEKNKIN
ncbi:hypothetical protein H311_00621 [Anncaliia algerae PRA109]|nr:hypothetical protein H311_00621 [Anncaliia algerae PRA109]